MSKVSIIIVNYNQGEMLRNCIESVLKYTQEIMTEFIVIDNSDKMDVSPYLNDLPNIILIKNSSNRGFAAANNQGLEVSTGDYVLFLNNDTLFIEDTLGQILQFYEKLKTPAFVGCKLLNKDLTHQFSIADFDSLWNEFGTYFFIYQVFYKSRLFNKFHLNYKIPDTTAKVDVIKGAFIFARLDEIKKLNGFDEDYFFYNEENDLCYRFSKVGGEIWYFPQTSIIHFGGATTDNMPLFSYKALALSKLIYYRKHFSFFKRYAFYLIFYSGYIMRAPLYTIGGIFSMNINLIKKGYYFFLSTFQYPRKLSDKSPKTQ